MRSLRHSSLIELAAGTVLGCAAALVLGPSPARAAPPIAATTGAPDVCSRTGWCWDWPKPVGASLNAIWGMGGTVWVAGDGGTVLVRDAGAWRFEGPDEPRRWISVWGRTAEDVWLLDERGSLAHHGEGGWQTVELVREKAARACASDQGQVKFGSLWVSASGETWAVGGVRDDAVLGKSDASSDRSHVALVAHFDGRSWEIVRDGDAYPLMSVFGEDSTDVWACGARGSCFHWNGRSLEKTDKTPPFSVAARRRGDPAAVAEWNIQDSLRTRRRRGGAADLQRMRNRQAPADAPANASTARVTDFFALAPNDVWAVGPLGVAVHWDGRAWSNGDRAEPLARATIEDLWCAPAGSPQAWAVGAQTQELGAPGFAWSHRETGWTFEVGAIDPAGRERPRPPGGASIAELSRAAGTSARDVWMGGAESALLHWNGRALETLTTSSHSRGTVRDLLPFPGGRVWVALGAVVLAGQAGAWSVISTPAGHAVLALAGTTPDLVWAHAPKLDHPERSAVLQRMTRGSWSAPFSEAAEEEALGSSRAIRRLALAATGDLWVLSDDRLARASPQGELVAVALPWPAGGNHRLQAMWLDRQGETWVATDSEIAAWRPGRGWRREVLPGAPSLRAICGSGDDLWAAGTLGILHKRLGAGTPESSTPSGGRHERRQ